jgi:hypothetical protein
MPDPSYMKWSARGQKLQSVDLNASVAGSIVTTLGPGTARTKVASEPVFDVIGSKAGSDHPQDINRSKPGSDPAETNRSKAESDPDLAHGQSRSVDEDLFRKFITFCIKCSHGFHANHAIDWFRGVNGRKGHSDCPVSECSCICDV